MNWKKTVEILVERANMTLCVQSTLNILILAAAMIWKICVDHVQAVVSVRVPLHLAVILKLVRNCIVHPRIQRWIEYFNWIDDDLGFRGTTVVDRVTTVRLKINQLQWVRKKELDHIRYSATLYFQLRLLTDLTSDNLPHSRPMKT
jgi:hypothetical protein